MIKFICENCNFKFESESLKKCPYCGKDSKVIKEKSAEDLLREN